MLGCRLVYLYVINPYLRQNPEPPQVQGIATKCGISLN
jgi:hypothetical protein